jgi:hypothetical protein
MERWASGGINLSVGSDQVPARLGLPRRVTVLEVVKSDTGIERTKGGVEKETHGSTIWAKQELNYYGGPDRVSGVRGAVCAPLSCHVSCVRPLRCSILGAGRWCSLPPRYSHPPDGS